VLVGWLAAAAFRVILVVLVGAVSLVTSYFMLLSESVVAPSLSFVCVVFAVAARASYWWLFAFASSLSLCPVQQLQGGRGSSRNAKSDTPMGCFDKREEPVVLLRGKCFCRLVVPFAF